MDKVVDLTIVCKIKVKLNGKMKKKARSSGKMVVLTEEVLVLNKEEVILAKISILEEILVIIISSVVKDIEPLSVSTLVNLKVAIEML